MMEKLLDLYKKHKMQFTFAGAMMLFMLFIWLIVSRKLLFLFGAPVVFLVGAIAIHNWRNLWYIGVFALPLSLSMQEVLGGAGLTFPTDLVALGLIFLILFKMVGERKFFFSFYNHPIFLTFVIWLTWMLITCIPSSMPGVSIKFTIAFIWMFGGFYVASMFVFREMKNMVYFYLLIGISFSLVMMIIMFLYVSTGRNPFLLRFNPGPFFVDHTVFGAFSATLIPMAVLLAFSRGFSRTFRLVSKGVLLFLLMGLFFSYSRGAWLSMILGVGLMGMFILRPYLKKLIIPIVAVMGIAGYLLWANYDPGALSNQAVSRKNFYDHLRSVTNFKSDDSNAERINRWASAVKMWEDRPVFGFGPGTYAFQYGDYQRSWHRTLISTNRADNGTAHNEVMLALSETGLPGAIFTFLIFAVPIFMGLRGFDQTLNRYHRLLYLGSTFGILTYALHSLVNNFMDQDKIGVIIFGMAATITALDLYHRSNLEEARRAD